MKIFRLEKSINLPITIEECWQFFSSPKNLKLITPAYMGFNIIDVEERSRPGEKISNKITKLHLYKGHLVRVQDLGLTWKMEFDITIFKMPAYDKEELNIFHLTQNGNDDKHLHSWQ